jgi:hypothetical protein
LFPSMRSHMFEARDASHTSTINRIYMGKSVRARADGRHLHASRGSQATYPDIAARSGRYVRMQCKKWRVMNKATAMATLTQSQSSKYRCHMGAIEPPTCTRVSGITSMATTASARKTSVKTNLAAAYWISATSIPTVELLLSASAVTLGKGVKGRPARLAAATAAAQCTKADLPAGAQRSVMVEHGVAGLH